MLISHRKKFIYTKTPKTAGTSVEVYFERFCAPDGAWKFDHERDQYVGSSGIIGARGSYAESAGWYNHMSACEIRRKAGSLIWD